MQAEWKVADIILGLFLQIQEAKDLTISALRGLSLETEISVHVAQFFMQSLMILEIQRRDALAFLKINFSCGLMPCQTPAPITTVQPLHK